MTLQNFMYAFTGFLFGIVVCFIKAMIAYKIADKKFQAIVKKIEDDRNKLLENENNT